MTADELLDAVTERLPSVSLPTIYATLELLEELGMVRRVQRAGTTLFDPRTEPHHHLVCTSCGSVEDLDSQLDTRRARARGRRHGFAHERVEALVHGRCRDCAGASLRSAESARRRMRRRRASAAAPRRPGRSIACRVAVRRDDPDAGEA